MYSHRACCTNANPLDDCEERSIPNSGRLRPLLELGNAIYDAKFHVVAQLNLDHLRGETLADMIHVLCSELEVSPASLDQMVQQERGEVLDLIVVGMLTEVEDLRHGLDCSTALLGLFIAE